MKINLRLSKLRSALRRHRILVLVSIIAVGILHISAITTLAYTVRTDISPIKASVEVGSELCEQGKFIFPGWYSVNSGGVFTHRFSNSVVVGRKYYLYASEICFKPNKLLNEKEKYTIKTSFKGMRATEKLHTISVADYPNIAEYNEFPHIVNIRDVLNLKLTKSSYTFKYRLANGDLEVSCLHITADLSCDLSELRLDQGASYTLSLFSYNEEKRVEKVADIRVETLNAVIVIESSIQNGATVLNPNQTISVTFNKEVADDLEYLWIDEQGNAVEHKYVKEPAQIILTPSSPHERLKKYKVTVSKANGTDGSYLDQEFVLEYTVGDGPAIISSNITENRFSPSGNIVINFNQSLAPNQNWQSIVSLNSGSTFTASGNGYQLTINPAANFDYCQVVTLQITPGVQNSFGLSSSRSYTYNFRTQCGRIINIGTSVQGRAIVGHFYGNGAQKIVLFGAMHGSEGNTATMLNSFISELEANPSRLPVNKTLIIVPVLNPDGLAIRRRFNANGVDLNRNFAASDWQQETFFAGSSYPMGGGSEPFSEPESRALRDLVISNNPYLTISYHSAASYVIPGNTGNSIDWGHIYAALSGYQYRNPDDPTSFPYPITGDFSVWAQEQGRHTLTIEFASGYTNEIARNREAIWRMIEL